MPRVRVFWIALLLLSYGAVGARQPAVHTSVPLGASARELAAALELSSDDRGYLLIDTIRLVYDAPDGEDDADTARRATLTALLGAATDAASSDTIPLPLDPSVWRDAILHRPLSDAQLIPAILGTRRTALLYHGLAALDGETLAALGPDRETLQLLLRHAGSFAAFGRSVTVRSGRVVVPGEEAEPLWQAIVGVEPSRPGPFVRRLFAGANGRLAYFFDTLAHLDAAHQRFAVGRADLPERVDRLRALLSTFEDTAPEWRPDDRPFMRPPLDPALTLSLLAVDANGRLAGPSSRRLWSRVFHEDDQPAVGFTPVSPSDIDGEAEVAADAAWVISRIHRAPAPVGRRRLDAMLFAQRVLRDSTASDAAIATILRGFMAYPALFLALDEAHECSDEVLTAAAFRARSFEAIRNPETRRRVTALFQASLGLLLRALERGGLAPSAAHRGIEDLLAIEATDAGYATRVAAWLERDLLAAAPADLAAADQRLIAVLAGAADPRRTPVISWEGRAYEVDATRAEAERIRRLREQQGGTSLEEAVAGLAARSDEDAEAAEVLARTLTSFLYAAHLGGADARALAAGDPALRHDLGLNGAVPRAWHPAAEVLGGAHGWKLSGSLLAIRQPLARHALRRLDATAMPPEPRISANERRTAELTVALLNPARLTDAARDEIAAAIARGRARLARLGPGRDDVREVADAAGLSEWRREALAWSIVDEPERVPQQLSLLELFWLGSPRHLAAGSLDAWGTAMQPLLGCPCPEMPRARPWEDFAGRPSLGLLSTRNSDVTLLLAAMLAERRLPAALTPSIAAYAMLDALEGTVPAYFDDWHGIVRGVSRVTPERLEDYVSALTAGGPLFPTAAAADQTGER